MRLNILLLFVISISCSGCTTEESTAFKATEVHRSDALIITQVSANTFIHTSYHQTEDFGNVPCNGLLVRNADEVIIFDTPTTDSSATELIHWLQDSLRCSIKAVVPTHFHTDCLGGLQAFHAMNIPSYANVKTVELARTHGEPVPQNSFIDSLVLDVGSGTVIVRYFGEGHTPDNVVGYFPSEDVLFGGCLIKELNASKGYLGDANVAEWSSTVERVRTAYPNARVIVPGHGEHGDQALLDYTIGLFDTH